jgi:HEAT repeat protein
MKNSPIRRRAASLCILLSAVFWLQGLHAARGDAADYHREVMMYGTDSEIATAFAQVREDLGDDVNGLVMDAFDEQHDFRVYGSLVGYIGESGLLRAAPLLLRELERPLADEDYLEKVVGALGKLKSPDSVEPLMTLYRQQGLSTRLKKAVITAFGGMGVMRVENLLIEVVEDTGEDVSVRGAAILALGALRSAKSYEMLDTLALNGYERELLRMYSAQSLALVGGERALDTLGTLIGDESHRVAEYAVTAVMKVESRRAGPIFVQALRSDFDKVRYYAVRGLADMRYTEAREILKYKARHDVNGSVRKEAQEALRLLEEPHTGSAGEGKEQDEQDL